ncbi:MAG: TIGR04282 family arsenosugar biosynthesis glycosyltransferase [Anaerolineales bacterium]|nr:TIGR04282 family arsenosugar biosynthesis glycosyltransferase [Anaerolineales bacterium]
MKAMERSPFLTVIVLTLNEENYITRVLAPIMHHSGVDQLQVLVVDGGSTDNTVELAGRKVPVISSPRGRSRQMNAGYRKASGRVLLFCHGDTLLPKNFGKAILEALQNPEVMGGAFQPVYHPPHPVLKGLSWVLRFPSPYLTFGDQAMFVRKTILDELGGVPPIPQLEDVALALAISKRGKLVRLSKQVVTSSRRFFERGVIRQLLLDIRLLLGYHLFGLSAAKAASRYQVSSRDQVVSASLSESVIGVIAKAPIPGHAKTRLAAGVGTERAIEIYDEIVRSLFNELAGLREVGQAVIFTPTEQDRVWFREHFPDWETRLQWGETLVERLRDACGSLKGGGAEKVLLIAADVPGLTPEILQRALLLLDEEDLVLGPSPDGGYYLIGMRECQDELFQGIPWSSRMVLDKTMMRADQLGLSSVLLPPLMDIDTAEDWENYRKRTPRVK